MPIISRPGHRLIQIMMMSIMKYQLKDKQRIITAMILPEIMLLFC